MEEVKTIEVDDDSGAIEAPEASETTETQEVIGVEAGIGKVEDQSITGQKTPYTPEELTEILKTDQPIDTGRLTPEGQALMKSFQRGLDMKFQELARLKEQYEEALRATKPQDPLENLYRAYVRDPKGVINDINREIRNLLNVSPDDEGYFKAQQMIYEYNMLKDELRERFNAENQEAMSMYGTINQAIDEIRRIMPDYDTKKDILTQFALEKGMTMEEITTLTNPTVVGVSGAVKMTKLINDLYEKERGIQERVRKKEAKTTPPNLVRGNVPPEESTTDLSALPYAEYARRLRQGLI